MIGILCEKPSAARNFAKALGGMQGTFNGEQYVIASALGHLYEFKDPADQVPAAFRSQYAQWDVKNLPWDEKLFAWKKEPRKDPKTGKADSGVKSTLDNIKKTFSSCSELVLGGDLDVSGEGGEISIEIFDGLGLIHGKKFSRMEFTDESVKSIQDAFKKRKPIPDLMKHDEHLKAELRSETDFLSMQWTRIATAFGDGHSVLRQGRLKSAMVKLVGDGLEALKNYKPVSFFQNRFIDENGVVYTNKDEPTFADKNEVPNTYHSSSVTLDGKAMKRTAPPRMLDLADLSARLAQQGYKPAEVLATYQKMYEYNDGGLGGYVSYPRTDDHTITPEQFNDLLPYVDKIARVVGVDPAKLTHRTPRSTHVKPQGAHGANRPGKAVPVSVDSLKSFGPSGPAIYRTLALNYLATLAEDYEYESQKGHVTDYPAFVGTASVPKFMGWRAIFDDDAGAAEDSNDKGIGTHADPFVFEGVNKRPPTPTIKWLVAQLTKWDVGTGATRTSTISEVTNAKSKYPLMVETKGKLTLTEYGDMSYHLLPDTHIGDLAFTERLTKQMRDAASGKQNKDDCLHEIQQMIRDDIVVMERNGDKYRAEKGLSMSGGSSVQKEKYDGTWNGKPVSFTRVWSGHRFTDDECKRLCNGETIVIKDVQGKNGLYDAQGKLSNLVYNKHKYVGFEFLGAVRPAGSSAGAAPVADDYYTGKWKRKEVRFKRVWSGYRFSDDECDALLAGETISFETTSARTGNRYIAKGKLAEQTYNGRKYVGFKADFS